MLSSESQPPLVMSPTYLLEAASPLRLCDTPCQKEDISEALSPFSAKPKLHFKLAQCEGATSSTFARFSLSIPTTENPYHDPTDFPFIANPANPIFLLPPHSYNNPSHPSGTISYQSDLVMDLT